ncbi:MAG TPA: ABC transporter permease/substrate-binding protein [Pirellulales bacterium]
MLLAAALSENLHEQLQRLPDMLGWHVTLSFAALATGVAISLPLGVVCSTRPRLRAVMLTLAGLIITIPSLALLALMVPLFVAILPADQVRYSIGFWPSYVALTLYSILPVLRNTTTGLMGVNPAYIEAARGVGMTEWQMLRQVQFPLAGPVIVAGIRTATVWVVGMATLATPVGAKCLGYYIFSGLQTQNHVAVVFGCVFAALLAVVLDQLIRAVEYSLEKRKKRLLIAALAALLAITAGATAGPLREAWSRWGDARPLVTVGAKPFTEQLVLADLTARTLQERGVNVDLRSNLGSNVLYDALRTGSVDVYVDYSGTIWSSIMKRTDAPNPDTILKEVGEYVRDHDGIELIGPLGFENKYVFAASPQRAAEWNLKSLADLTAHARGLRLASDYEFFGRLDWRQSRDAYGLGECSPVPMDSTQMYEACRSGAVDVIVAYSTDARLLSYGLVTLADPKRSLPPYHAILLASQRASQDAQVRAGLTSLVGRINDRTMLEANNLVDSEGRTSGEAATWLWDRVFPSAVVTPTTRTP